MFILGAVFGTFLLLTTIMVRYLGLEIDLPSLTSMQAVIGYMFGARFDLAFQDMGNSDLGRSIRDTFKSVKQTVLRSEL